MNKTLAILGAGELGKQIANFALNDCHYDAVLFYDDFNGGSEIQGNSSQLELDYGDKKFDELIIGIGYNHLDARKEKYDYFKSKVPFGTIVHSSCWVDPAAMIEPGCVLYPRSVIDKNVLVKHNTILNLNCTISHDTTIGSHSFLGPGVAAAGFVTIGENCFIGINSTIIDNIAIASGTHTGGGAVIIKTITEPGLYAGNPAKKIK